MSRKVSASEQSHTSHYNPRTDEGFSICDHCGFESDGEHCTFCCDLGVGVCEFEQCRPDFGPHEYWADKSIRLAAKRAAEAFALTGEQLTLEVSA